MKNYGWLAIIAGAVMLEVLTAPGTAINGQSWTVTRSGSPGHVWLRLERARPGSRMVNATDVPLANFQGFTADMLNHSGPAKFEYVQDAGRLICTGRFGWGRGTGAFTVALNPAFVADLNRLGYPSPQEDQLFVLMMSDVDLAYAREIRQAIPSASLQDLVDLKSRGITLAFIHETAEGNAAALRADDYIALHDHGVDTGYIRALKNAGYELRPADMIELHDHGVNGRFAGELKQAGYTLPAGDMVRLKDHGVDSGFVRDLHFLGIHPPANDIVQLKEHGVSPEYLRRLREGGLGDARVDDVVELQQNGVDGNLVVTAHDLGYRFTAPELVDMQHHGVDAAYLRRLHDAGMQHLSEPQITQLRMHGVD